MALSWENGYIHGVGRDILNVTAEKKTHLVEDTAMISITSFNFMLHMRISTHM